MLRLPLQHPGVLQTCQSGPLSLHRSAQCLLSCLCLMDEAWLYNPAFKITLPLANLPYKPLLPCSFNTSPAHDPMWEYVTQDCPMLHLKGLIHLWSASSQIYIKVSQER